MRSPKFGGQVTVLSETAVLTETFGAPPSPDEPRTEVPGIVERSVLPKLALRVCRSDASRQKSILAPLSVRRARNLSQESLASTSGSSPSVAEKRSSGMRCPDAKPIKQIFRTTVHYNKAALVPT
jgi:hypothetical protein